MFLGKGSYGEVTVKHGVAVKKFVKLSHLIQEYAALKYLEDCKYIVKPVWVNFGELELGMQLYDMSLRKYLEQTAKPDFWKILYGILSGLVELHDRGLVHGDIKPGNILVNLNPFKVVLGDCGFVSIGKYAKVERTAAVYRETEYRHDCYHDMYSLGICILEMASEIRVFRQSSYREILQMVNDRVRNKKLREIIYNLIREDRENRFTARGLMRALFKETPLRWSGSSPELVFDDSKYDWIRRFMKTSCYDYDVNRAKKGYKALSNYLEMKGINSENYKVHTLVTIMILSALFGNSGFNEHQLLKEPGKKYPQEMANKLLLQMLSDEMFVSLLFAP